MKPTVSFGWEQESPEAKVRWFKSLTAEERIHAFCEFMDLALALNPRILEKKNAPTAKGRVQIIRKPQS